MTLRAMAALFIRIIGLAIIFYGAFNMVLFILFDPWALSNPAWSLRPFLGLILGSFLIAKSRSLAKVLSRGLEDL